MYSLACPCLLSCPDHDLVTRTTKTPRNLGLGDSSHARYELSRSAVPVGMESHQHWRSTSRFRHPPLEILVIFIEPLWSCIQSLVIAWNSISRKCPPATVILGLVMTQWLFTGIYVPEIRPRHPCLILGLHLN